MALVLSPEKDGQEEGDDDYEGLKKRLVFDVEESLLEPEPAAPSATTKQPVQIYLRIRPKNLAEITRQDPDCLHTTSDHELFAVAPKTSKTFKNMRTNESRQNFTFSFTNIFSPSTTQKELFDETLRPLLKDFFDGQNCLVFTYGVTNSGV